MNRRWRCVLMIVLGVSWSVTTGGCRKETPAERGGAPPPAAGKAPASAPVAEPTAGATPAARETPVAAPQAPQSAPPATSPLVAEPARLTVAFVQVGAESAWRTAETKSIQAETARRPGVTLKSFDAQQKQENQIRGIKSFVAQDVDVLVLAPVVETGWEPALREAKEAGIPVVLVDRGVNVTDDSLYTTLIASDFVEEGRMAGRWLADKTGGKCNIVELQGTVGSAPAIDRKKGFEEIITQHPDMKIIKSQSGDFTRAGGKQVMEAFIKAEGRNIQAVYAHNDDMAIGAIQALKDAGMKPGQDVLVISIDAVRAAFEAMIAGELNATVECSPLFGPILFDTIEKIIAGQPVPKKIINQDRLFEQHDAAALIDSREY